VVAVHVVCCVLCVVCCVLCVVCCVLCVVWFTCGRAPISYRTCKKSRLGQPKWPIFPHS
jgi:hypothetical protein